MQSRETLLPLFLIQPISSFDFFVEHQVIVYRGLPFELHVPNEKTRKAIENSRQGKGKRFSTAQALFDDPGI